MIPKASLAASRLAANRGATAKLRAGSTAAAVVLATLLVAPTLVHGQSGSLAGSVTGPDGTVLPDATVRVVGAVTGVDVRTLSVSDGSFTLRDLAPDRYSVLAAMPCCSFLPYRQDGVEVAPGQQHRLDIRLDELLVVLADDPALVNASLRVRQQVPDEAVPRTAEGKPDLGGVWFHTIDALQEGPVALPWAEELAQARIASVFRDHPHTRCLPGDVYAPGAASFMLRLVQTPDLLAILFEDVPGYRQVFLDGRAHPVEINPSWMGHSIGRWEGDTLVVETVGFNDRGWNDAYPRTEGMRLEERFTRSTYGRIDVTVTIEDPGVFERPWVRTQRLDLAPQEELFEYVCENNKWGPNE